MRSLLFALGVLPAAVSAADILKTDGFSTCLANSTITVQKMNIEYNKDTAAVIYDVAGTSSKEQNVTATMTVYAYGKQVYEKSFNPCDEDVTELCPVPKGSFSATGSQDIPSSYSTMIPSIAFNIPDLDGTAKMELKSADTGEDIACVQSTVNNGKTASVAAVQYVAAGIAAAALAVSALGAMAASGAPGTASPSPTFMEVMGWFQGMAMNGMLSVNYPSVYKSFTSNFAFSGALIPWGQMQTAIDNFRQKTGGNLTDDSYTFLSENATLVYQSSSTNLTRRGLESFFLWARDLSANVNGASVGDSDSSSNTTSTSDSKTMHFVHGIEGYVEQLTIPQANTFMTVLLIFAIVIAAITVGILLFKVILEIWSLFGSMPKSLQNFRKRYWWLLAKTITQLILLLYGVWVLYCVYQFKNGDSWAAKVLAGVTLGLFTAVLGIFVWRIWSIANKFKKAEGDASALFEDKETWLKYSFFYENFKKSYWWLFLPSIVYMFAKSCVIAGFDGHGLSQTAGQLLIEAIMLCLLLWSRPYGLKSGNWINIIISVVRVLSVVCILVFVEELGISQSTKTITGVVLIVVQSVLTGVLAILIAVNSIIICCRENPHRKKRREAEKLHRDLDNLTPLDARNSLLLNPTEYEGAGTGGMRRASLVSPNPLGGVRGGYNPVPNPQYDQHGLLSDAASMGHNDDGRSTSPQPRLPSIDIGHQHSPYRDEPSHRW